jgi:hypothetical protein
MREMTNAYKILGSKPKGDTRLGEIGGDNIKVNFKAIGVRLCTGLFWLKIVSISQIWWKR